MDLARRLIAIAAIAAGCGGVATGTPLTSGETARLTPSGLRIRTRAATGVLAYRVALDRRGRRLITIELATSFELVARDLDRRGEVTATRRIALGPADYDIRDLALAGDLAYVASADGSVRAIDVVRGATISTWRLGDVATAVAVSADGAVVATGTRGGVLCMRRRRDGALLHCVVAHDAAVSALDFSRDQLASAGWDGQVKLWSLPGLAAGPTHRVRGSANDVAFSPDGGALAVAVSAAPPVLREARDGRRPTREDPAAMVAIVRDRSSISCLGHAGAVSAVSWTPDGGAVISASWDRTIRLWDANSGREIGRVDGLAHIVRDVASGGKVGGQPLQRGRQAPTSPPLCSSTCSILLIEVSVE